jgi:hypothetical protein
MRVTIGVILPVVFTLACGDGSSAPSTPSASLTPSLSATPTGSATASITPAPASPTPSPVVTPAGDPCTTDQLEGVFLGWYGLAGTTDDKFELRNSSDRICYLTGYVSVRALDAQGSDIQISSTTPAEPPAPIVVLPPDTEPIPSVDNPSTRWASGHGFVNLLWGHCELSDPTPARWLIIPPGQSLALTVDAQPPLGHAATVCQHPLSVYAIQSAP